MPAHFIDSLRASLFVDACMTVPEAGLSWSSDPDAYLERMPFDRCGDTREDARNMAGGLSGCGLFAMGRLQDTGINGTVRNFRGKLACDPLSEPYAGRYDNLAYLLALGQQSGALRTVQSTAGAEPDFEDGTIAMIGGDDGLPPAQRIYGGGSHIVCIVGRNPDGSWRTVEGGKLDAGNKQPSPRNCTRIEHDTRELYRQGGNWWLRDATPAGARPKAGRMVRWWYRVRELPVR